MLIRTAVVDDAESIAWVQIDAWKHGYVDLVPHAYLTQFSVPERATALRGNLAHGESTTIVVEQVGQVVGWATAGPSRDADQAPTTQEIWGLYVAFLCWRTGVGRALLTESERRLSDAGAAMATLWVLEGNVRARAFYEAGGWRPEPGSARRIERGGRELMQIRMQKRLGA